MSDAKKFSHASDQGDDGLLVVTAHEMLVKRSSALIVLDPVHTGQGEDLSEHWISCSGKRQVVEIRQLCNTTIRT